MQTHIFVHCGAGKSLREAIVNSPKLAGFDLKVDLEKTPGRYPGWADLSSTRENCRGTLKLKWDDESNTLICRVVNRGKGKPGTIAGDFLDFLLDTFYKRILSVTVSPDPRSRVARSKSAATTPKGTS